MAIGSRQYVFELTLSDVDRAVYETLTLRVAQHASESEPFLVARVLAYALCFEEGTAFSRGLCVADEPAVWTKDLTGRLRTWIDVGTPDAARLHKASKAADRVVVFCHKPPEAWLANLSGSHVHRAEQVELVLLDPGVVGELARGLSRRNVWSLSVTEGTVYLDTETASVSTTPTRRMLGG